MVAMAIGEHWLGEKDVWEQFSTFLLRKGQQHFGTCHGQNTKTSLTNIRLFVAYYFFMHLARALRKNITSCALVQAMRAPPRCCSHIAFQGRSKSERGGRRCHKSTTQCTFFFCVHQIYSNMAECVAKNVHKHE